MKRCPCRFSLVDCFCLVLTIYVFTSNFFLSYLFLYIVDSLVIVNSFYLYLVTDFLLDFFNVQHTASMECALHFMHCLHDTHIHSITSLLLRHTCSSRRTNWFATEHGRFAGGPAPHWHGNDSEDGAAAGPEKAVVKLRRALRGNSSKHRNTGREEKP